MIGFYTPIRNLLVVILIATYLDSSAQIPVEIFLGHKRSTLDVMFFKYFRNGKKENTTWLFFNRNRLSLDYRMTGSNYLPQFGFTEAVSYNDPGWKGFAPVLVGQALNSGVFAKAGLQYAHMQAQLTVFTWFVCEIRAEPRMDYFLLVRFTPGLTGKVKLFSQLESVNAFPTKAGDSYSFIQRLRLGLQLQSYQFGAGSDFSQTGRDAFTSFSNVGLFIRHEF